MTSPPIREGPHEKGYMAALAAHVKLYGSVDATTLHLVAFPPGMTKGWKPHDPTRVMQELCEQIKCEPKDGNANLQVVLHTNRGSVEFRLFPEKALSTCLNFVRLIDSDYYNGLIFHRIIANFMIQGGCPNGNGRGGPGYAIRDEINDLKHHAGRLAMANSGANSAGSQFYVLVATPNYDVKKYTVFGEVTQGLEIVYLHSKVKTDKGDRPLETQRIRHMELRP